MAKARKAAKTILEVVDRQPVIDSHSDEGETLASIEGRIVLENVHFSYPSRPDTKVCNGYSLEVEAGTTVALVGASGSGKSTAIQLVERFYDPDEGTVSLDGTDLRKLNVKWLREQIGLVGQEPVLFGGTIAENIAYALPNATKEQIETAAKNANAYNFIMEFEKGFDTDVGDKGSQLSGGQKQRVAIARAIIKNPKILLLDEATSALDTESERVVQEALDDLMTKTKRTTIVVAHRLSTIRNADKIAVVDAGAIVEQGTFDELMAIGADGWFHKLAQRAQKKDNDEEAPSSAGHSCLPIEGTPVLEADSPASPESAKGEIGVELSQAAATTGKETLTAAEKEEEEVPDFSGRVRSMHDKEDTPYFVLGTFGALLVGGANPAIGLVFVKCMWIFYDSNPNTVRSEGYLWSGLMGGIALCQVIGDIFRFYGFGLPGEKLTVKLRDMYYRAVLRQEIGWHDLKDNAPGIVTAQLASEVNLIQALSGETLGKLVLSLCTIIVAFALAFGYGYVWITLVALAMVPVMMSGMAVELALLSGGDAADSSKGVEGEAGRIVGEVVNSIRTVASFTLERPFMERFEASTEAHLAEVMPDEAWKGAIMGYSQGSLFACFAFLYWFGGKMVADGHTDLGGMFIPIFCMFMIAAGLGAAETGATDTAKAAIAARRVFEVVDRESKINFEDEGGETLASIEGRIVLENVHFSYPSRPDTKVCNGYSLEVEAGTTVALVGASGSGKSTAIQLVERFYDPDEGTVSLDGTDLRKLNVKWLREQIGLVGQEPVLFGGTIAENIAYALPNATKEQIETAAKNANAYNFIMEFEKGFDTDVGDKGSQLSGGQKQRVAIARAIIKNPKILLLDEATSALDTESERVVQEALDDLMTKTKRTTIVVAHRLSTIRNADKIAVVDAGAIVEQGTYDELVALGGKFYTLSQGQVNSN